MVALEFPGLPATEGGAIQRQMLQECFAELQTQWPLPSLFYERTAALVALAFLVGKGDGITSLGADVKEMIHKIQGGLQ